MAVRRFGFADEELGFSGRCDIEWRMEKTSADEEALAAGVAQTDIECIS